MEKKPFTPAQEPEMPQYVMSVSDRRARNQDGTFISNEAVENAHQTYDTEKAAFDEQEADRLRVYENAAVIPEDTDISKLTATDLQEKLGITYKQALELQDAGGNGAKELIDAARAWKAEQPEETPAENKNLFIGERGEDTSAETKPPENDGLLDELPEFLFADGTVVDGTVKQELTGAQMQDVLEQVVKQYKQASENGASGEELAGYRTRAVSAFEQLQAKESWPDKVAKERRDALNATLGIAETEAAKASVSSEEPSLKQLDRNLRGLISNYRKNKADLLPEAVEESKEEILAAFEQLKAKAGWDADELSKRQDQLFEWMGEQPAGEFNPKVSAETQAIFDKVDAETTEKDDLVAVKDGQILSKQETMDAVVNELNSGPAAQSAVAHEAAEEQDHSFSQEKMDEYMRADFEAGQAPVEKQSVFTKLKGLLGRRKNKTAPKGFRPTAATAVRPAGVRINAEKAGSQQDKAA